MRPRLTFRTLLALACLLVACLGSCHTLDKYRPGPAAALEPGAVDPRPDLPGVPVGPGHPLAHMEAFLRSHFPTHRPWVLRSTPLVDPYLGVTHYDAPGWQAGEVPESGALVLEVRDDLVGWQQRDILLHEYAHILAWDAVEQSHGAVWAAYFGALYRATRGERP